MSEILINVVGKIGIPLFIAGVCIGIYVYHWKIVPTLDSFGSKAIYPLLPSEQIKQIIEYKKICIGKQLSLKYWYFIVVLYSYGMVVVSTWILLLILSV